MYHYQCCRSYVQPSPCYTRHFLFFWIRNYFHQQTFIDVYAVITNVIKAHVHKTLYTTSTYDELLGTHNMKFPNVSSTSISARMNTNQYFISHSNLTSTKFSILTTCIFFYYYYYYQVFNRSTYLRYIRAKLSVCYVHGCCVWHFFIYQKKKSMQTRRKRRSIKKTQQKYKP